MLLPKIFSAAIAYFLIVNIQFAQITINNTHMPVSGDTLRFSNANSTNINTSQTGINQTWDFSALTAASQGVNAYKTYLQTPYIFYSQFAGSIGLKTNDTISLGIVTISNVHTFYRNRTTGYTGEGTGFTTSGIPLASDYTDPDMVYKFPLDFNQKDTDNFKVTTAIPTIGSLVQQGTRFNSVDGWGKISTPFKKDVPCLRIVSNIAEIDSIKTSFISFGFPLNRREYKWLSLTDKMPILESTGTVIGGNYQAAQVKYRDSFRGLNPQSNPLIPRPFFTCSQYAGSTNLDTFTFDNLTTPVNGNTYIWSFTPANAKYVKGTNQNSKNPAVVFTNAGVYDVNLKATNAAGNKDSSALQMITISIPLDIQRIKDGVEILLMPNPVTDLIYLEKVNTNQAITLNIYDINGKLIRNLELMDENTIDISQLATGRYIIIAKTDQENIKLMFDKI